MKKFMAMLLACLFVLQALAFAGLGSDKTKYVGGTENQIKDGMEGESSAKDEANFVFEYKNGKLSIPYDQVDDLEYGQKAGRRLGLALTISPWLLLSKKRKHFLTVGWKDAQDKQHAAVFELGKSVIRTTIATLEARTGKKVDYQDDEARKSGLGGL
ncbi:MAG TPA: hypothetical protein VGF06_14350 [Terriglobales bacterium]|jgi:hypothetical protein